MAGALLERELAAAHNGRVEFAVANQADDADIRRLLRENPMPGRITLSLEREPDFFADAYVPGETKQTIIARENGRAVCLGSCAVRQRFVSGQPLRVGYLGGLRLDASQAGRFDILRRGYEFFRGLQAQAPAEYYFTSIAADNERARQFLERGLPGMPQYEFAGEFVTVLLSAAHGTPFRAASQSELPSAAEIAALLNEHNCLYQLAPCWSARELAAFEGLGLQRQNFRFIRKHGRVVAGAAVWDQRMFKQTVIRGYRPSLASWLPVYRLGARMFGWPQLPTMGTPLPNAFISHLMASEDEPQMLIRLISELRGVAAQRGIEMLTVGFAANDWRLAAVRRHFRRREYRSRLYIVRWPGIGGSAGELKDSILAPEAAFL